MKKGFKVDRRERFLQKTTKKTKVKPTNQTRTSRVKKIVFDEASRKDFVLGLHKRKNERRVTAFVDGKKKVKRENSKLRHSQREQARQAYNNYAQVPILPDYTFHLPTFEDAQNDPTDIFYSQGTENGSGGVNVSVKSLQAVTPVGKARDFTDLPKSVASVLEIVARQQKGKPRTPGKVNMLKELQKIRKIQKHSRKGHGKKGAKGKGK